MKTGKFLMALQTWPGDLAQADALTRLLVDCTVAANGGQKSPHADLIFCVRHDTELPAELVRYAAKAFTNVRTFRARNRVEGWPMGPNNLAMESYRYFVSKQQAGVWNYSGLWLTEPDSVPLASDFLARISREWCSTDKPILGSLIGSFSGQGSMAGQGHVNGNCLLAPSLADTLPDLLSRPTPIAWDAQHRREMVRLAKPSVQIFSDYKLGDSVNPWRDCGHLWRPIEYFDEHPLKGVQFRPAWLHGCKDPRGLECARERLLGATPTLISSETAL